MKNKFQIIFSLIGLSTVCVLLLTVLFGNDGHSNVRSLEKHLGASNVGEVIYEHLPSRSFNGDGTDFIVIQASDELLQQIDARLSSKDSDIDTDTRKWWYIESNSQHHEIIKFAENAINGINNQYSESYLKSAMSSENVYTFDANIREEGSGKGLPLNASYYLVDLSAKRLYVLVVDT